MNTELRFNTWKIWAHFAGLFSCFLIGAIVGTLPRIIYGFEGEPGWMVFAAETLRIIATLGALILYGKYVLKLGISQQQLSFDNFQPAKWGVIGLALPLLTLLIFQVFGKIQISYNPEITNEVIADGLFKSLGMALAAGILEEIVFRGYLVAILKLKYQVLVAALTPSLLFILLHVGGVQSRAGGLQLLVAGLSVSIMFLVIRFQTGSVWNASVVHFIWNFIILNSLVRFGMEETSNALIQIDIGQESMFNGGEFGIEASIPAVVVYVLAAILVWKWYEKRGQQSWGVSNGPDN